MIKSAGTVLGKLREAQGRNFCRLNFRCLSEATDASASTAARSAGSSTASTSQGASGLFEKATFPEPQPQPSAPGKVSKFLQALSNGIFYTFLGGSVFVGYYTYAYTTDKLEHIVEETKKAENSFPGSQAWVSLMSYYLQQRKYVEDRIREFSEPPSDKLLPDLPPQYSRHVRTLVLDLDDVLIHADWTRQRGWRSFKRPGAEEFIKHLAQYYELVVYTSQHSAYADPILDRIDPNKYISYRLYRNSTFYKDGKHARDLSKLNRDLSKVLFISANPDAYFLQPENTIKLPVWNMDPSDTTLLDFLPFLEAVARTGVPDVRDVVNSYDGLHIPTAFKERMMKVQELQKEKQTAGRGFLRNFVRS